MGDEIFVKQSICRNLPKKITTVTIWTLCWSALSTNSTDSKLRLVSLLIISLSKFVPTGVSADRFRNCNREIARSNIDSLGVDFKGILRLAVNGTDVDMVFVYIPVSRAMKMALCIDFPDQRVTFERTYQRLMKQQRNCLFLYM